MYNKLLFIIILCYAMVPLTSQSASGVALLNCFSAPGNYNTNVIQSLSAKENVAGKDVDVPGHLVGDGSPIVANCDCPKSITASSRVNSMDFAGSPLSSGVSGYGYLTDSLDIQVSGYTNAINSPAGTGLTRIPITQYPTPIAAMQNTSSSYITEGTADVCSDATRPSGAATTKRQFKWNVIIATFYIKKPILGEKVIPPTLVVQNFSCLFVNSFCSVTSAQQVSNIWLAGTISAPLSCTINAGGTIEIALGSISNTQFESQGNPPSGYTLKDVDISYHCDGSAIGNNDKIKLTLTADQGVSDTSTGLIAKMIDRDDIGVRMYDSNNNNVVLDGSVNFPITLDEQGNGSLTLKAAPVSTTNSRPAAGRFEGNVTVKMDLR